MHKSLNYSVIHFTVGILAVFFGLVSCARESMSVRMVRSEMERCPSAAALDGMAGRLKWNYTTGLELLAMLDARDSFVADAPRNDSLLNYVDAWYDAIINEDGSIGANYKRSNYNVDHICPARTLFKLYDLTGKAKYRAAIDSIYAQVKTHPRTETGNFWHKKIYPHQVWLDGLYMALPFYAMYADKFLCDDDKLQAFNDIALQFRTTYSKCYDPASGVLRHAWDESKSMFWADPVTGQSAHSWGRAMGWYMMALIDVLDFFPEDNPSREDLVDILITLLDTLLQFADPATGMWYQVLDCPGREGNYIEATCSAMFTYVYLKAADKGYTPELEKYARKLYRKFVKAFVHDNGDGTITLTQCCAVAGLGGKENRSGDYDYYIHEKITENDPKGVGPFIWASLIYEK